MTKYRTRQGPRRLSYRFQGNRLPALYRTDFDDGTAVLQNISTTGCALAHTNIEVFEGDKILVRLELPGEKVTLEARGKVVRSEENCFCVRFTHIENSAIWLIRTFFLGLLRAQKSKQKSSGIMHIKQ